MDEFSGFVDQYFLAQEPISVITVEKSLVICVGQLSWLLEFYEGIKAKCSDTAKRRTYPYTRIRVNNHKCKDGRKYYLLLVAIEKMVPGKKNWTSEQRKTHISSLNATVINDDATDLKS